MSTIAPDKIWVSLKSIRTLTKGTQKRRYKKTKKAASIAAAIQTGFRSREVTM